MSCGHTETVECPLKPRPRRKYRNRLWVCPCGQAWQSKSIVLGGYAEAYSTWIWVKWPATGGAS